LVYTAFQEARHQISHANVASSRAAKATLHSRRSARNRGDEARHEAFYTTVMGKVMEQDPKGA